MKKSLKAKKLTLVQTNISTPWQFWVAIPLFLMVTTIFVYYPSLSYGFLFDDIANITKHFELRNYTFGDLFFSGPRWISYWLNSLHYSYGKFDPWSYRLFNISVHCLNGVLLFFILMIGLSKRQKSDFFKKNLDLIAALTALLFLLHAVQTQTVSYVIQGQLEGLATFFILTMILMYMLFCYTQNKIIKLFSIMLLLGLTPFACCTKEIVIISPLLLFLIDWFFIAQGSWTSCKTRLWLLGSIAMLVIGVYAYFFKIDFFIDIFGLKRTACNNSGNIITHTTTSLITPQDYFISQFKVIVHYFWIFLWPFSISAEYDWVLSRSFFAADSCVPFFVLCLIIAYVIRLLWVDRSNLIAFGFCWFFICILPRSSIIPSPELVADYKTYMASCGYLFLLATGGAAFLVYMVNMVTSLSNGLRKNYLSQSLALSLVIPFGIMTMQRNMVWRSGLAFWGNILKNAPGKARAYNNYGVELLQKCSQPKESIPYFNKAIALDPHYYDPYNNLAVAYLHTDQPALALETLYTGLKINPCCPEGYNNLASFLLQQQHYDEAESALYTALQLRPHYGKAHYNLGRLYFQQGKLEDAWQHFYDACMTCDLDDDMGFTAFAKLSLLLKKYDHAIFGYKKILAMVPDDQDSLFNLGNTYFFAQQYNEALRTYEHLVDRYPDDIRGWYNLAEVYFTQFKPDKALACFNKVVNHTDAFPTYHIRVAQCYAQLGHYEAAYAALDKVVDQQKFPEQIVAMAHDVRQQIEKRERQIV